MSGNLALSMVFSADMTLPYHTMDSADETAVVSRALAGLAWGAYAHCRPSAAGRSGPKSKGRARDGRVRSRLSEIDSRARGGSAVARRPGSRERSPRPEDLVFPPDYERDALDAGPHSGLRQDRWPPARPEGEHRLPGAGEYRRRTGPGRRRWGRCYTEWSFKLDGIAGPFAPGPRYNSATAKIGCVPFQNRSPCDRSCLGAMVNTRWR